MTTLLDDLKKYTRIGEATTLGWAKDEYAQKYMQQLLVRAEPILSAHNWRIKCLKEFYPRSARLLGLNVNKGAEVCVRFRVPGEKTAFLPLCEVICTLLHEIAHCKYSRHDKYFWNLYSQLVKECEQLELSISMVRLSEEKTEKNVRFSGSHRLGGNGPSLLPSSPASMRQILADAAQRRLGQSRWGGNDGCGCDDSAVSSTPHGDGHWICAQCGGSNVSSLRECDVCSCVSECNVKENENEKGEEEDWDCIRCLYHNYRGLQNCEACSYVRSSGSSISEFSVQRIKTLTVSPGDLSIHSLLGSLANVADVILQEREWQVICLSVFSPTTPSVVSRGEFLDSKRAVVQVRVHSPNQPTELLPPAYIYTAVFHQLAHMIQRRHGVAFLEIWVTLLKSCLRSEKIINNSMISNETRENLIEFTRQLESILKFQNDDAKRTQIDSLMCLLSADCGNVLKRERSNDEDVEVPRDISQISLGDSSEGWMCSRCGFLNSLAVFLYCEMCGTCRALCPISWENHGASSEEHFVIDDSDDDDDVVVVN